MTVVFWRPPFYFVYLYRLASEPFGYGGACRHVVLWNHTRQGSIISLCSACAPIKCPNCKQPVARVLSTVHDGRATAVACVWGSMVLYDNMSGN